MIRRTLLPVFLFLLAACGAEPPPPADHAPAVEQPGKILVHNARIYTMNEALPAADAMLFDSDGTILGVGDGQAMLDAFPDARRIDLDGKTVLPGLIDAHAHLYGLAVSLGQAQLQEASSKEEVIQRLREHEQKLGEGDWLLGHGWDQNDWPGKQFPTAADLDGEFPDRPVWLGRIDGHAGWANSAALAQADRDLTGDWQPQGGFIHRGPDGKPTGVLVDSAVAFVADAVPEMSQELLAASLELAIHQMLSLGLTGVHDMGVSRSVIELYQRQIQAGRFPARVYAFTDGAGETLDWLCASGAIDDPSGRLHVRAVKLFIDGAMGSRGAVLFDDYSDEPGNRGLLFMSPEELEAKLDKTMACGFQAGVHAIGDKGIRVVLDAYQKVLQRHQDNPGRHRIEHVQAFDLADAPRFAELDIIASMQPVHASSDMYWIGDRLGPERVKYAYAFRTMVDNGARLALGSDFPVEKVNPMLGIYAGVTRQDSSGWPPGGWQVEQALTREELVRGFTLDAAYSGFMENEVGSLEAGKRADFIVLDRDIFEVPATDIDETQVLQTWLDGELVYTRP